jgi:hypothetical protein
MGSPKSSPTWTWDDIAKLRQLLAAAGSPEELKRWIDIFSRTDSKFVEIDHELLAMANLCFFSSPQKSVKAAIHAVVKERWQAIVNTGCDPREKLGATMAAAAARIYQLLQSYRHEEPALYPFARHIGPRVRKDHSMK